MGVRLTRLARKGPPRCHAPERCSIARGSRDYSTHPCRRLVRGVAVADDAPGKAYALAGRWRDALCLPARAAAAGVVPDEQLYASVLNALGDNGAWSEAVDLVLSMRCTVPRDGDPLEEGADAGFTPGGSALDEEPPRPGQAAYAAACRACARQGQSEAVAGLIDCMRADGVRRTTTVYACAMRAFGEAGQWERAVQLVRDEVRGGEGKGLGS